MSDYTMSRYSCKDDLIKDALADLERHKKALGHCKGYLFMLMSDEEQAKAKKEIEAILNPKESYQFKADGKTLDV